VFPLHITKVSLSEGSFDKTAKRDFSKHLKKTGENVRGAALKASGFPSVFVLLFL